MTDVPRMGLAEKDKVRPKIPPHLTHSLPTGRRGDSLRSLTHATTAGPDYSYRLRCPFLRSSRMTRVLGHASLQRITCVPSWMTSYVCRDR